MNKSRVWIAVIIPCSPESFEAVENFLFEHGSCGLVEGAGVVTGYFSKGTSLKDFKSLLGIYLESLGSMGFSVGEPVFREIPAQDWNSRWREHFKPVQVTSRIVVKPPWEG